MRGDDQASRYPPRGVWFGLILLCGIGPVLFAQDEPNGTTARRVQDPIVLAGRRVTAWSTADGRWVHLFDRAAVLQGVEGLRAKEAIVRIVEQSSSDERTFQVEVYAEGDVSVVGASGSVSSRHTILHTAKEPQLSPYHSSGFTSLKQPPRPPPILLRSGFLVRKPDALAGPSGSELIETSAPGPGLSTAQVEPSVDSSPGGTRERRERAANGRSSIRDARFIRRKLEAPNGFEAWIKLSREPSWCGPPLPIRTRRRRTEGARPTPRSLSCGRRRPRRDFSLPTWTYHRSRRNHLRFKFQISRQTWKTCRRISCPCPDRTGDRPCHRCRPTRRGSRAVMPRFPRPYRLWASRPGASESQLSCLEVVGDSIFPSSTSRPTVRRPISVVAASF